MQFPSGSPQQILDTIAAETQNTRQAIEVSQSLQNQVAANQSQIWAAVQRANAASQSAPGQLAAQQQTNQILTAEIQQLGDLQAILISDERAQQATKLEDQSREEGAAQLNSTQGITFNSNQQGF
jgi:P-type conjugative transfer protein TrbJ